MFLLGNQWGWFFLTTQLNWLDSRKYCKDRGGDMIILNSEVKQVSLVECLLMNERNNTYSCFYSHTEDHNFIARGESVDWFD